MSGFTRFELVAVIIVVAILGALMYAGYTNVEKRARDAQRIEDVAQIVRALDTYYRENRAYPTSTGSTTLGATWNTTADGSWKELQKALEPYIETGLPTDPLVQSGGAIGSYNYAYYSNPKGENCGASRNQMYLLVYKLEASAQVNTYSGVCNEKTLMPYKGVSNYRTTRL